jgi:O-succinylbenzoic acid--CoA ligase
MLEAIKQTVRRFAAQGIGVGERVAILSEPSAGFYVAVLACWKLGAVAVPLSSRYPAKKINTAMKMAGCRKVLVSSEFASIDVDSAVCRLDEFVRLDVERTSPVGFDELGLDMEADASIIFTSGSSGEPKGVLHTIANHYYSALGSHENIPFGEGDAWLAVLPMYHVGGFSMIMRTLVAGGTLVFGRGGESPEEAVMRPATTHLSLVPTQLMRLLDRSACVGRMREMKAIIVGGAGAPCSLMERSLACGLPVCTTYGSTEAASQVATGRPGVAGGVKVLPYRTVEIAEDGEITLKGRTLFKGYVSSADRIDTARDEDGFFHTGDIGALDEHDCLHVTGRKDTMFVSGGESIYPEEIERALMDLPDIEQAVVVPVPDRQFGQLPLAFIKTKGDVPVDVEAITAHLRNYIEGFRIPRQYHRLPESAGGMKPARNDLVRIVQRLGG